MAGNTARIFGNKDDPPPFIFMKKTSIPGIAIALFAMAFLPAGAAPKADHKTWTDPAAALREDPDFAIQGEYLFSNGNLAGGAQVVALGGGKFDAYLLEGGLPGAGWMPGNKRIVLHGARKDDKIVFADETGTMNGSIRNGRFFVMEASARPPDGFPAVLERTERQSPTLGAKPPQGAIVLFDGTSTDAWENGKMENGHLLSSGATSKQHFADYTLHLEFRTPYTPGARGQQRGNSGVYHSGRWETQVLDSFGLEGRDNECGGIYSISKPRLNMCLPPLAWQTYDVGFTAAKFDANGKRVAWPRITVKLNGVVVHENLELAKDFTTSAPITTPLVSPQGPVFIQNHNDPVVFRNIWVLPSSRPAAP
jgi:Domain of Unknown Function (DUF1080)